MYAVSGLLHIGLISVSDGPTLCADPNTTLDRHALRKTGEADDDDDA